MSKSHFRMLGTALAVAVAFAGEGNANPVGPQVASGTAIFRSQGNALTISNTPGTIINWQGFSIGANEVTRFQQQNSASAVLNRVGTSLPSTILGQLLSNGRVYLINPNGITVGAGALIDTAGFVASSLNLSDADFLTGRHRFGPNPNAGAISNAGTINANGGPVYLVAPDVENTGIIASPSGQIVLAAGRSVELIEANTPYVRVKMTAPEANPLSVNDAAAAGAFGTLKNSGLVSAGSVSVEGGRIVLHAEAQALLDSPGRLDASSNTARAGSVQIAAPVVLQGSEIRTDGARGGSVSIDTINFLQTGAISARGVAGDGGEITVQAHRVIQTATATIIVDGDGGNGGAITVQADSSNGGRLLSSATFSAVGARGGAISLLGEELYLLGATLDASGDARGGAVLLGGDFRGENPSVPNASRNWINFSTSIAADARASGDGGKVVVWSDADTRFAGHISARGGAQSGDGGSIEVSGRDKLLFAGTADAGAAKGAPGTLLLDPKNIVIDAAATGVSAFQLINPNPGANNAFPGSISVLGNNNVVATDPNSDFAASNAGAAYLFNGTTGALVSAITGSSANDQVGVSGVVTLTGNNNFVVRSQNWKNGTAAQAGAATWGNGVTGFIGGGGAVSTGNSLVGTTALDQIGYTGVTALSNGNYVVGSALWDNGAIANAGAVTWGNGSTGIVGVVSAANSLVGGNPPPIGPWGDLVGYFPGVTALPNGNYVVVSEQWGNDGTGVRGAVTWVDGANGRAAGEASPGAVVSVANSLVGGQRYDEVGKNGVTVLANGNYVVKSGNWKNGGTGQGGAVTWGSGASGVVGVVSAANSLVGSHYQDFVGSDTNAVIPLANGNYIVQSTSWDNGAAANAGAVTWVNGSNGRPFGAASPGAVVSAANSLVGSSSGDQVGLVTALTNGNYVVSAPLWSNGATANVGAVTFGNGATGTAGAVSTANSLVGSATGDYVGADGTGRGVYALNNGNYIVASENWANGAAARAGAVTWVDGTNGRAAGAPSTGAVVSAANSLVGSGTNDRVGDSGVVNLTNGNYVVKSYLWNGLRGAATWVDGSSGRVAGEPAAGAVVSATNSLVGSTPIDFIGQNVTALANGNYVASSNYWSNGPATNAGAVTWGSGTSGVVGVVSAANSLVGSTAGDNVGGVTALANGNYVVASSSWSNGAAASAGAVTFGSGTSGVVGAVSAANSLVGSTAGDGVGAVTAFSNSNYVVASPSWTNGAATAAGAVTFGSGSTGITGAVTAANSLVGTTINDHVGTGGITKLASGNYVVNSYDWNNGAATLAGAVTFGNSATGISGAVSALNSFAGTQAGDQLGYGWFGTGGITALAKGSVVVSSPNASTGVLASAGLAHVLSPSGGFANPLTFATDPTANTTLTPATIAAITNSGTAVTLQANNDITLAAASPIITSAGGAGGALTLQAGRSVLLNSSITTDNGALTIIANERAANGVVDAQRDAGAAAITMAPGTAISAGSGAVTIELRDGAGLSNRSNGAVTLENIAAASITVANIGPTTGNISAGGSVNAGMFTLSGGVWNQASSPGVGISVSGAASFDPGSRFVLTSGVATFNGTTTLASLDLQGGTLTGSGAITLTGGSSSWSGGSISGTGSTTVSASSVLNIGGAAVGGSRKLTNQGTLNLANSSLAGDLDNQGILNVSGTSALDGLLFSASSGTLNLNSASVLTKNGGIFDWIGGTLAGSGALGMAGGAGFNIAGGVRVLNGPTLNLGALTIPGGSLELQSGAINLTGPFNVNAGASLIATGGSITSTTTMNLAGTLRTGAGSLAATALTIASTGILTGNGSVAAASVTNNGTVAPGNSPGTLTINGNYLQGSGGTLAAEIGGTTAGAGYDQLIVTGNATLAGTLSVTSFGGFGPAAGDTFRLVKAGGELSGTFATLAAPVGTSFGSSYLPQFFDLTVSLPVSPPVVTPPVTTPPVAAPPVVTPPVATVPVNTPPSSTPAVAAFDDSKGASAMQLGLAPLLIALNRAALVAFNVPATDADELPVPGRPKTMVCR